MIAYLINLDRCSDRVQHMNMALQAIELDVQRVSAVDGAILSGSKIASLTRPKSDRMPWTPAEVGCALSHRKCWKAIAASADRFGAVFEDDLHFAQGAGAFLATDDWIPQDIDLIKLETYGHSVILDAKPQAVSSSGLHRLRSTHYGTGGYIVSSRLAEHLIDITQTLTDQVDVVMFGRPDDVPAYQLVPAICIQDSVLNQSRPDGFLRSTVEAERIPLRAEMKPRGLAKLRREAARPFRQLAEAANGMVLPLRGKRRMVVPFGQPGEAERIRSG